MSTAPHSEGYPQSPPPVHAQVVYQPPPPPPRRRSGWGRFFLFLLLLAFAGSLFLNLLLAVVVGLGMVGADGDRKVQERFFSHQRDARDKVAIISVEGIILETEDGFVKRQIDRALEDENVRAVVLRVNSPGGSISGSDYIYHHLRELAEKKDRKIPIVVSMGGLAASGGYYVSMAAGDTPEVLFAEPTTFTGSIGVIIPHYNIAGLMEKVGAEEDSVTSGPLKEMGSLTRPMTKEERTIFQQLVDDGFNRFKEIVKSGRPNFRKNPADLDRIATGQVYTADQALKNGLIDHIGFIEDAVDRAIVLGSLDKNNVKVVKYKPEVSLSSLLLGGQARGKSAIDLQALLEMTTPRAFYLCTWLPGLASAKQ
jgi:protease IV